MAIEAVKSVRLMRGCTAYYLGGDFVTREFDVVQVDLMGMNLTAPLNSDRAIRLAHGLAKSHGAEFDIEPEYEERVRNALGDLIHSHPISIR